jgi:hypothetical protein
MQRGLPFYTKVFPFFKNGQNKCPISILATDFGKKYRNLSTFVSPFPRNPLQHVGKGRELCLQNDTPKGSYLFLVLSLISRFVTDFSFCH